MVEIDVLSTAGKNYVLATNPDGEEICANIYCGPSDPFHFKNVEMLIDFLKDSVVIGDEDDEWDEDGESGTASRLKQLFSNSAEKWRREILADISGVDQIQSITLKRIWTASGEAGSAWGYNVTMCEPELVALAKDVIRAEGEEKVVAETALQTYLNNYRKNIDGGWSDSFPTGFLGATVPTKIVWNRVADSLDALARIVVFSPEDLNGDRGFDYAEETTEIDMQTKVIKQTAEYILDGDYDWEKLEG